MIVEGWNYYWLTFSFKGENQGVIVTQNVTPEYAFMVLSLKGLVPQFDDIRAYTVPDANGLELNRLYSPDELEKFGFDRVTK